MTYEEHCAEMEMESEAGAWWLFQDVSPDGTQAISYGAKPQLPDLRESEMERELEIEMINDGNEGW